MVVGREVFVSWLVIQELYTIGIDTVKGERRESIATCVASWRIASSCVLCLNYISSTILPSSAAAIFRNSSIRRLPATNYIPIIRN